MRTTEINVIEQTEQTTGAGQGACRQRVQIRRDIWASVQVYSTVFVEVHITEAGTFVELYPVQPCQPTRFAQLNGRALRNVFPNARLVQFI